MSAGQPNWLKLFEQGKLPKEARGKIPLLVQIDAAEDRIEKIKKSMCPDCRAKIFGDAEGKVEKVVIPENKAPKAPDAPKAPIAPVVSDINVKITLNPEGSEKPFKGSCMVEGCDYEVDGMTEASVKSYVRMHNKKHEDKINKNEE